MVWETFGIKHQRCQNFDLCFMDEFLYTASLENPIAIVTSLLCFTVFFKVLSLNQSTKPSKWYG